MFHHFTGKVSFCQFYGMSTILEWKAIVVLLRAQKGCWITLALRSSFTGEISVQLYRSYTAHWLVLSWSHSQTLLRKKDLKKYPLVLNVDLRSDGCVSLRLFLQLSSLHHMVHSFFSNVIFFLNSNASSNIYVYGNFI